MNKNSGFDFGMNLYGRSQASSERRRPNRPEFRVLVLKHEIEKNYVSKNEIEGKN